MTKYLLLLLIPFISVAKSPDLEARVTAIQNRLTEEQETYMKRFVVTPPTNPFGSTCAGQAAGCTQPETAWDTYKQTGQIPLATQGYEEFKKDYQSTESNQNNGYNYGY